MKNFKFKLERNRNSNDKLFEYFSHLPDKGPKKKSLNISDYVWLFSFVHFLVDYEFHDVLTLRSFSYGNSV